MDLLIADPRSKLHPENSLLRTAHEMDKTCAQGTMQQLLNFSLRNNMILP